MTRDHTSGNPLTTCTAVGPLALKMDVIKQLYYNLFHNMLHVHVKDLFRTRYIAHTMVFSISFTISNSYLDDMDERYTSMKNALRIATTLKKLSY